MKVDEPKKVANTTEEYKVFLFASFLTGKVAEKGIEIEKESSFPSDGKIFTFTDCNNKIVLGDHMLGYDDRAVKAIWSALSLYHDFFLAFFFSPHHFDYMSHEQRKYCFRNECRRRTDGVMLPFHNPGGR